MKKGLPDWREAFKTGFKAGCQGTNPKTTAATNPNAAHNKIRLRDLVRSIVKSSLRQGGVWIESRIAQGEKGAALPKGSIVRLSRRPPRFGFA